VCVGFALGDYQGKKGHLKIGKKESKGQNGRGSGRIKVS